MALPRLPKVSGQGGFRKHKIQLSLFIRDQLASGIEVGGHELYTAYKTAVQSEPTVAYRDMVLQRLKRQILKKQRAEARSRKKVTGEKISRVHLSKLDVDLAYDDYISKHPPLVKRRCISYNGFMHYLWVMHKLGLIEYTGDQEPARVKSDSSSGSDEWYSNHPSIKIRAVGSMIGSPSWQNIWKAYNPSAY
jgi:hypothetical protein